MYYYWPNNAPYSLTRGNGLQMTTSLTNREWYSCGIETMANAPTGSQNSNGTQMWVGCAGWSANGTPAWHAVNQGGADIPGGFLGFADFYGYDNINRLTSLNNTLNTGTPSNPVWTTEATRGYGYDNWGNLWVSGHSGGPWAGNTPTTNVFNPATNRNGTLNYDAAGNQLTINGNNASFNAENEITSLSTPTGATTETMRNDGLGRRVQKTPSGGPTTTYVYDAFGLAAEYSNGVWAKDYIFDGGHTLYATENPAGSPCTTCYHTTDYLGSTRMMSDQHGNAVGRHDYLPYGEEIAGSSAGRNASTFGPGTDVTEKFTGQIRDQEAGQDYFNARYFTAALGRFNSPDPGNAGASLISSQSWNGYAYVLGNPLSAVDPSGETESGGTGIDCQITPGFCFSVTNSLYLSDPYANAFANSGLSADPPVTTSLPGLEFPYPWESGSGGGTSNTRTSNPAKNATSLVDQTAMKSCLDSFYNSKAGQAINFVSPGSMLWGPEPLNHAVENGLEIGTKVVAVKAGQAAAAASISTLNRTYSVASPLSRLMGWVADTTEALAKRFGGVTVGVAAGLDASAHLTCAYAGESQASQALVNISSDASNAMQ